MGNVEREVNFGLEHFSNERKVEVPLQDALYAFKVIGEFISFFHQPAHWKTLADVERFIGHRDEGGLHVLWEAYYKRLRDVWPQDVQEAFDDGLLDRNPIIDGKTG
jgi:hypothetical protein